MGAVLNNIEKKMTHIWVISNKKNIWFL